MASLTGLMPTTQKVANGKGFTGGVAMPSIGAASTSTMGQAIKDNSKNTLYLAAINNAAGKNGTFTAGTASANGSTSSATPQTGVTYKDFTRAAKKAGFSGSFDQSDLDLAKQSPEYGMSLIKLKKDLAAAKTNEQRLLARRRSTS